MRDFRKTAAVAEPEVASYLGKAECSDSLRGLFECAIHENRQGSGVYAYPTEARRSICGCHTKNLRLELYGTELRATLVLFSGEVVGTCPWLTAIGWTLRMPLLRRIAGRISPLAWSGS